MTQYEAAKKRYAERGVDADAAINTLKSVPVSLHCWQGDDVRGFDGELVKALPVERVLEMLGARAH